MRVILLGGAGFIGINLVRELSKDPDNEITVVDRDERCFPVLAGLNHEKLHIMKSDLTADSDYEKIVEGQDVVYHLISSTVPGTSNQNIVSEVNENIVLSINLFEACVRQGIQKIVFLSSGGTVYGKRADCPLSEVIPTNPITSYGVQKVTIEKLLYLYNYMYGVDYRIIRLANPYGPYQKPDGVQGAVTSFIYKALRGEEIQVYGDGSVVRDFIYIDDAVRGIQTIVNGTDVRRAFNLGCGYGTSIKEAIQCIESTLGVSVTVRYTEARKVDVPVNFLDISRYETAYGKLNPLRLEEGILKTAAFFKQHNDNMLSK